MNKFNVMSGIEIELVSSDNLTLGSFIKLCHMHSIDMKMPINVYEPDENISYWVHQILPNSDTFHLVMSGEFESRSARWNPAMLVNLRTSDSYNLVDIKNRRLKLLGWGEKSITLESRIESVL